MRCCSSKVTESSKRLRPTRVSDRYQRCRKKAVRATCENSLSGYVWIASGFEDRSLGLQRVTYRRTSTSRKLLSQKGTLEVNYSTPFESRIVEMPSLSSGVVEWETDP